MKVKRKYKQGDRVDSVAELLEHDWFIVHFGPRTTKTMHKAVLWEWKLKTCQQAIDSGRIFIAVKLTNGEYYGDMTRSSICSKRICANTARAERALSVSATASSAMKQSKHGRGRM